MMVSVDVVLRLAMKSFILIILSVGFAIAGQFCLKHGVMQSAGRVELNSLAEVLSQVLRMFQAPFVWGGLMLYGLGAVAWMMVLSREDISFAFPMLGIGYVVGVFIAFQFGGETVSFERWLGVFLIMIGVVCIGNEALLRNALKSLGM